MLALRSFFLDLAVRAHRDQRASSHVRLDVGLLPFLPVPFFDQPTAFAQQRSELELGVMAIVEGRRDAGFRLERHHLFIRYAAVQHRSGCAQRLQQRTRVFDVLDRFEADRRVVGAQLARCAAVLDCELGVVPDVVVLGVLDSFGVHVEAVRGRASSRHDACAIADAAGKVDDLAALFESFRNELVPVDVILSDAVDRWRNLSFSVLHVAFQFLTELSIGCRVARRRVGEHPTYSLCPITGSPWVRRTACAGRQPPRRHQPT